MLPERHPTNTAQANVAKAQAINKLSMRVDQVSCHLPSKSPRFQEADCWGHRGDLATESRGLLDHREPLF
jgi:hypothetical protein